MAGNATAARSLPGKMPSSNSERAMSQPFDLDRFVAAQDQVIDQVRRELRAGAKRGHWMWFVFPQLAGLGRSEMARRYALASLGEATAYLRHPVLGPRLVECSDLVLAVRDRSVAEIFGAPDDLKLHSCMTLFAQVPRAAPVFGFVLATHFDGVADRATLAILARQAEAE